MVGTDDATPTHVSARALVSPGGFSLTHTQEQFTDPLRPARDVNELLQYLTLLPDEGRFLYRGQKCVYPGALLPSGFRHILHGRPLTEESREAPLRTIRQIGHRFVGNYVWDGWDYLSGIASRIAPGATINSSGDHTGERDAAAFLHYLKEAASGMRERSEALKILEDWCETCEYHLALEGQSPHSDMRTLSREEARRRGLSSAADDPEVSRYLDNRHRDRFLNEILVNSLGFTLGSLVGQHYGFFSGMLDATTSLDVAAFFATHVAPDYSLLTTSSVPGVIYRFTRMDSDITGEELNKRTYYDAPGTIAVEALLRSFEADVSIEDSLKLLMACYELRRCPDIGVRRYDRLCFPAGSISKSRIGRQHAAVIIPDEIHAGTTREPVPHLIYGTPTLGPPGLQLCQQSIEDLHSRPGVQRYYFRHSPNAPHANLTADYLWPSEDVFLKLLSALYLSGLNYFTSPDFPLPMRFDLVDAGPCEVDVAELRRQGDTLVRSAHHGAEHEDFVGDLLDDDGDRMAYLVFKAAALCRQGHALGDAQSLESSLRVLRKARLADGSSCALAALETIVLEALRRQSEIRASTTRLIAALRTQRESGTLREHLAEYNRQVLDLYARRFDTGFSVYFYNLYQSL